MAGSPASSGGHLRVLTKHFLIRTIGRDTLSFHDERIESLVFSSVFFAILTFFMSYIFLKPYVLKLVQYDPGTIWMEETAYLTLIMTMMGMVCTFTWEGMFVDRRDFENLGFLPVSSPVLFLSKFTSMWVLVAGLSLISNNPLTVAYFGPFFLATVFFASLFVFLLVAGLHMVLMAVFSSRFFKQIAVLLQFALLGGFVSVFFWFPGFYRNLINLVDREDSAVYLFPPLWFVGLNQWVKGEAGMTFRALAGIAVLAVLLLNFGYLATLAPVLRRELRRIGRSTRSRRAGRRSRLQEIFHGIFLRHPLQRAVFYYFIKILARDQMVRIQLALILAFPCGFAATRLVDTIIGDGTRGVSNLEGPLLGLPVYLLFFLLFGLRAVITHPVAPQAAWIFSLTDRVSPKPYASGLRRAIVLIALTPTLLALFVLALLFWPWEQALGQTVFSLVLGILLIEGLFFNYRKIPFAVEHLPGRLKLKNYWPLYLLAYMAYVSLTTASAHFLLTHPVYYTTFVPGAAGLVMMGRWLQNHRSGELRMQYEDRASPYLLTLNLDN